MKSNLIKGITLTVFATLLTLLVLQQGKFFDEEQQKVQQRNHRTDVPSMKSATPKFTDERLDSQASVNIEEKQDLKKTVSFQNYVVKTAIDSTLPKASNADFEFEIPEIKMNEGEMFRMMSSKSMIFTLPFDLKYEVAEPSLISGFIPPLLVPLDSIRDLDTTKK